MWRVGSWLVGSLILGLASIPLLRHFDTFATSLEADSALVAYRKAGLPWEAKDLAPNPAIPPERNAAPVLVEALRRAKIDGFRKAVLDLDDPKVEPTRVRSTSN